MPDTERLNKAKSKNILATKQKGLIDYGHKQQNKMHINHF